MLPEEVRLAFGARSGGVVMAQLDGDEFKLVSVATALKRVRARLAPYFVEGVSWVDELIAERRNEQEREDQGA